MCNHVDPSFDTYVSELRITSPGQDILPHSKTTVRIKDTSFRVDVGVGGVVSYSVSGLLQRPKLHHLVQRNSKFPRRVSSTPTVAQETKHFGEI